MKEEAKFFEDFEIGESFVTSARTITETDIVMHVRLRLRASLMLKNQNKNR